MRVIAIIRPAAGASPADFGPLLVPEERHVWAAYKSGLLRDFAFQADPLRVVLVFEVAGAAAARAVMADWPMVKAGLLDGEFIEAGPWVPLEHLFGPQAQG